MVSCFCFETCLMCSQAWAGSFLLPPEDWGSRHSSLSALPLVNHNPLCLPSPFPVVLCIPSKYYATVLHPYPFSRSFWVFWISETGSDVP